jgi:acetyl-CoA acetyltransferase
LLQPAGFCSSQHYYRLEDLGFLPRGEAVAFIAERNTALGGKLPLNTNGGGLS